MCYIVDDERVFETMTPELYKLVDSRAYEYTGDHLETVEDAEEYVELWGELIGVELDD